MLNTNTLLNKIAKVKKRKEVLELIKRKKSQYLIANTR